MKKEFLKWLLLVLLQFACFILTAQKHLLDSLDREIAKAKTDTDRIQLNIRKIDIIDNSNLDSAILLSKIQLKEAERINYYDGIIELHQHLANNYCFTGNYAEAKKNIQFLEKFVKPSDSLTIAGNYAITGMMYGIQAMYDSSILFYTKAIAINERLKNTNALPANYGNIAIGYQQLANYPKALDYQQRCLKLAEKQHDEQLRAKTLLNMGITFISMGDTAKAEQYYLASLDAAEKNNFKIVELYVYTNLASLYTSAEKWEKGYIYAMKAADMSKATGDLGIKGASIAKAAIARANQNRFEEATALSKQAILLTDSSAQPFNISQAFSAMATTLFLQKKYKEAIPYFEKCFDALRGDVNFEQSNVILYKSLSESYEKTGNFIKALANYKLGANMEDSLKRKSNIRRATELSMKYDFEKAKEVLAAKKKKDEEVAQTKQTALIAGLALVFILALVAFRGYTTKQKANKQLKLQKEQIQQTLSELKTTQAQLIQSEKMASLGELTAGIAHEIQNPLNFVNNFSDINKDMLAEMREAIEKENYIEVSAIAKEIEQNEEKIVFHGKRADAIVKGMLQHSRGSTGQKEPTNINTLAEEYLRLAYHGLRAKDKAFNATLKTAFDDTIGRININRQDIGRVMLNLITNAFYAVAEKKKLKTKGLSTYEDLATRYEPAVSVSTKKADGHVIITVSDNGNGIPQKILDKIFQPFFTTKPTGQGTGLGLSLAYDIVKSHGGQLKVHTREGEGSEFVIELPVV